MALHTFDVAAFRALFAQFTSDTVYPDATLQLYWDTATSYISAYDACRLTGAPLQLALNLMTAHLAQLFTVAASGVTPVGGVITSATIDKVSVTASAPPTGPSGWRYWLATTPYGLQLWALLSAKSVGGWAVGGSPERRAIRKVGGRF